MTILFYPPSARWRVAGAEALCDAGDFRAYVQGLAGRLLFREGYFLYTLPAAGPGQPVALTEAEERRLRPHFSEKLLANYSLLDNALLLWEDGRSVREKLILAAGAGLTEALVPEAFKETLMKCPFGALRSFHATILSQNPLYTKYSGGFSPLL
ncbi:MAG: hypothetical protein ACSW8F_04195 [bacterium]